MVLTGKTLDEILNYLDRSVEKLAQDTMETPEFQMDNQTLEQFLSSQYDVRLENLLEAKNSNIHHLESGMKNKIIQRKQKQIHVIMKKFQVK
ncbi:MAG: hypothetical protein OEM21_08010 [Nitrosopumilus sp.]|nr:hypothetical protein [Nitrosopumilus sp.]